MVARTSEIGIRMSVGATPPDITAIVLGTGAKLAFCGIILGTVMAALLTRAIVGLLFAVEPIDPFSFLAAAMVLFVVALFGSYIPATRAAHVDPLTALRQE